MKAGPFLTLLALTYWEYPYFLTYESCTILAFKGIFNPFPMNQILSLCWPIYLGLMEILFMLSRHFLGVIISPNHNLSNYFDFNVPHITLK